GAEDAVGVGDGVGDAELAALLGTTDGDGTGVGCPFRANHNPRLIRPSSTTIATTITIGAHHVRGGPSSRTHPGSGSRLRTGMPARADQRAGGWPGSWAAGSTEVSSAAAGRGNSAV